MRVVLFDIDGTLLLSGGAGVRAMMRAFEEVFGVRDGFTGISMAGRTDGVILRDGLTRAGIGWQDRAVAAFKERYYALLAEEIEKPLPKKGLLDGVRELLAALGKRPDVLVGLLTGNWEVSGRIKIGHFGIAGHFPFGAFSDDSENRDALFPIALERARTLAGEPLNARDAWVIGDTPHDVRCAQVHGANALAVSTGTYTYEALAASGAEALARDLSDLDRITTLLLDGDGMRGSKR